MRVGSTFTRKKKIRRGWPRKKPNPPQPEEPKIEITREDGIGQPQQGGPTGPYPDQIAPPDPRLDSSGQQQGGGTATNSLDSILAELAEARDAGRGSTLDDLHFDLEGQKHKDRSPWLQERYEKKALRKQHVRDRLWEEYGKKDPQPKEIEITQKDGFGQIPPPPPPPGGGIRQQQGGGTYEQGQRDLQNMFSNAQRSGVTGPSPGFPAQMGLPPGGGTGQQQGGTGQPMGRPMGQPLGQQQGGIDWDNVKWGAGGPGHGRGAGIGLPQQQGIGRPQGGMPGNVGGGTKRPIGVPSGRAGGTPRGY